jgi:hypothetical protein
MLAKTAQNGRGIPPNWAKNAGRPGQIASNPPLFGAGWDARKPYMPGIGEEKAGAAADMGVK